MTSESNKYLSSKVVEVLLDCIYLWSKNSGKVDLFPLDDLTTCLNYVRHVWHYVAQRLVELLKTTHSAKTDAMVTVAVFHGLNTINYKGEGKTRRRKTPISNRGGWSSLNLFRYIHLGECHSKVKHGTWAAAGFVPEMAEEPHYGQRYPRILMEASTGNQETGSILRCGKEQEATTLSPKRAADDRWWNWLRIHSTKGDVTRSSTTEKKDIGVVVCCRQPSSRKVD